MGLWRGRNGLYVAAFLMDASLGIVGFAVPLVAIDLGAQALQLGLVGAGAFVYAVSCIVAGPASDRMGRRASTALGALTASVVCLSMVRVQSIGWLLGLVCASSFGVGLFWPAVQAWLSEEGDPGELPHAIGVFNMAWSAGLTVGPLLSAWLRQVGLRAPFYAAAAGYLSVAMLVCALRRPDGGGQQEQVAQAPIPPGTARRLLYVAWTCNFASWFMSNAVKTLFPKLAKDMLLSETTLSWLIFSIGLAQLAAFAAIWRGRWWHYRLWPILAFQALGAAGMALVLVGQATPVLALGMLMAGAMTGMTYYASLFYSLRVPGGGRGLRTGVHEAFVGAGILLGPLAGGLAAHLTGSLRAPYLVTILVIAATAAAGLISYRRPAGTAA